MAGKALYFETATRMVAEAVKLDAAGEYEPALLRYCGAVERLIAFRRGEAGL